jgi:galactonate dehydratase
MGPEAVADATRLRKQGWDVIRFVGSGHGNRTQVSDDPQSFEPRESIAKTVKWLPKIREALDAVGHTTLILEYHHRLSVAEAASLCQKLPPGTIDALEEPIRDETPEAFESLRTMTPVPFALGEEFSSKWQFIPFIEKGLANFCRVDIINVGGFTETMKVAGMAEAHYIDLMPHNPFGPLCTAACIHVGVATPNFAAMEVFQDRVIDKEIFPQHHTRVGGDSTDGDGGICYPTPTSVGLGVDVNEAELMKLEYKLTRWNNFLRRKDGSVTNW